MLYFSEIYQSSQRLSSRATKYQFWEQFSDIITKRPSIPVIKCSPLATQPLRSSMTKIVGQGWFCWMNVQVMLVSLFLCGSIQNGKLSKQNLLSLVKRWRWRHLCLCCGWTSTLWICDSFLQQDLSSGEISEILIMVIDKSRRCTHDDHRNSRQWTGTLGLCIWLLLAATLSWSWSQAMFSSSSSRGWFDHSDEDGDHHVT